MLSTMNAVTLALYAGFAVFTAFPYKGIIVATGPTPLIRTLIAIALFAAACGASYYVIRKHMGRGGPRAFMPKAVLVILDAGFLLAVGYYSFAIEKLVTLPGTVNTFFDPAHYFFFWFIAPLIALFVV